MNVYKIVYNKCFVKKNLYLCDNDMDSELLLKISQWYFETYFKNKFGNVKEKIEKKWLSIATKIILKFSCKKLLYIIKIKSIIIYYIKIEVRSNIFYESMD